MSIKSVLGEQVFPRKPNYPYLGSYKTHNGQRFVVLFTEKDTGFVVYNDTTNYSYRIGPIGPIGQSGNNWIEMDFKPLIGSVSLSNEAV